MNRQFFSLCITAALVSSAAGAAELSVCVDKSSPSAKKDAEYAKSVAQRQGATLHVDYFDGTGGDHGFPMRRFNELAKSCDLIMGFPVDATDPAVPEGLRATAPYGTTGFVLVTPKNSSASSLSQLPNGSAVAVVYQTAPNMYFAGHDNIERQVHMDDRSSLDAVESGKAQAAMLWQASTSSYLDETGHAPLAIHELNEPHARFNMVALYDDSHAASAHAFEAAGGGGGSGTAATSSKTAAPAAAPAAAAPTGGALPALYTAAQSTSGEAKYRDNCALCHGPDLTGRAGPALKGPNFASTAANFHVSDIFTIVSQNMPATNPGSLDPGDYVEIMAFLLKENGYPAGTKALTFDDAKVSKVPLSYQAAAK